MPQTLPLASSPLPNTLYSFFIPLSPSISICSFCIPLSCSTSYPPLLPVSLSLPCVSLFHQPLLEEYPPPGNRLPWKQLHKSISVSAHTSSQLHRYIISNHPEHFQNRKCISKQRHTMYHLQKTVTCSTILVSLSTENIDEHVSDHHSQKSICHCL